jgi:hypothetical protein
VLNIVLTSLRVSVLGALWTTVCVVTMDAMQIQIEGRHWQKIWGVMTRFGVKLALMYGLGLWLLARGRFIRNSLLAMFFHFNLFKEDSTL